VSNAFSVSGIFDLTPLVRISVNQDLRLDDAEARRVSPVFWPAPAGTRLDSLVGALESSEFLGQARLIADTWGKAGVATDYDTVADKNHFTVCDELSDGGSAMVERLVKLATS